MSKPITVRGVQTAAIPRGQTLAVFCRGFDLFTARGTVQLAGEGEAEPVNARVVGAEVGRLYNLAQRFGHQSPQALVAPTQGAVPGMVVNTASVGETALFDALADENDPAALSVTEPYTVVLVQTEMVMPTMPSSANQ